MMEFLVTIDNRLPPEVAPERREELRRAERARARELRAEGVLVRLWRIPGTRRSIGLFEAEDATQLHAALSSLPLFPWQGMTVQPLATHPQEMDG